MLEAAIDSFRKEAKTLYGDNNVKINVVDGASLPAGPANIKPLMQIGVALAAGFALAVISLFFMYDYRASRRSKRVVSQADSVTEAPAGAHIDTPRDSVSVEAKLAALEPSGQDIMFGVSVDAESETPAPKATKAKSKSKKTAKSTKTSTKKSKKQP